MMAMHQGNFNGIAAQYIQGKLPFGGLLSNYMVNSNVYGVQGLILNSALRNMQSSPMGLVPARFPVDFESVDMRKSSIDTLRMKAKDHSTTVDHLGIPQYSNQTEITKS